MDISQKLSTLRKEMVANKVDLYLVPTSDAHQSEYVGNFWKCRQWISGFRGSAGLAVIGHDFAHLWTDGRYFLQAKAELEDSEFKLMKQNQELGINFNSWLKENILKFKSIGANGEQYTVSAANLIKKLCDENSVNFNFSYDLISNIWSNREALPNNDIFSFDIKYAGVSRAEKITNVRKNLKNESNYLLTALDSIAWILNLRGSDISFNPVFYSYLLISNKEVILFINENKLSNDLKNELLNDGIKIYPYNEFYKFLENFENNISLSLENTNFNIYKKITKSNFIKSTCPVVELKAIKNNIEINNLKEALKADSIALINFFMWLENNLNKITEYEASKKLSEFRSKNKNYLSDSFKAIIGYKENGAVIHYTPRERTAKTIESNGVLLVDSGGQYLNGTTDITRTISLGETTEEEKENYTLVLKGHIALAKAKFLEGTSGSELDILARQFLFNENKNYKHGTGHGVGFCLNVHEGPQGIAPARNSSKKVSLAKGMLMSNEPGFYKDNDYGIRIENLILVIKDISNSYGNFLKFETLTFFPIDLTLVNKKMLLEQEVNWINEYHTKVYEHLCASLDRKQNKWLKTKCKIIS
ncbi:UNVERIFIED_CONTAM: hypothetical protein GTU68_026125 [Idotea baltica]|nr:hypothetical protein [Idotea baltica]